MLIKTKYIPKGFQAFTVYPFIFIKPEAAEDKALIAHETVHYLEQKGMGTAKWLLKYATSTDFRYQAEVRAYKKQIELGGITLDEAASMIDLYKTNKDFIQIAKDLAA